MVRFLFLLLLPGLAAAQACPEKTLYYWQAFPAGGESDISARHQQLVLKKKCPAIETIIQYKPGAGGALLWTQANALPADGFNVYGIIAAKSGFELVNVGVERMDGFMKDKVKVYTDAGRRMGLGAK